MGESSDKMSNYDNIFCSTNIKKPLALYNKNEKHILSLSSRCLKPQDVLATVSKQLKDIQKADSLHKYDTKVKHIAKLRNELVPIDALFKQEAQDLNKFETQCVTDTQLIHIVDSIEAMVDVNKDMCQEFAVKEASNFEINNAQQCSVVVDDYGNQDLKQNESGHKNEWLFLDDINTDVYKEFDTSYSETVYDPSLKIKKEIDNEHQSNANICTFDVVPAVVSSTRQICIDGVGDNDKDINYSSMTSLKYTEKSSDSKNNNVSKNISRECDQILNHKINTQNDSSCSRSKQSKHTFNTEIVEIKSSFSNDSDVSGSPVFESDKSTINVTPPPFTFLLELFEKFASIAMPLIEENSNLEAVKHYINSQIINNQLLLPTHAIPELQRPSDDLIFNIEDRASVNDALLNAVQNNEHVETSIMSIQNVNEFKVCFEDEILFSSDEENDFCCVKDLPMTCPLKTDVAESQIDLDETIYVGFQTSSNKCIQVCKDSFVKAKKIFSSIQRDFNTNLTLTELVDIQDSKISTLNNNVPSTCGSDNKHTDIKDSTVMEDTNFKVEEAKFVGSKTATLKLTEISEQAILKCKTALEDIEDDIVNVIDYPLASHLSAKKREFMGFKTASNKKIKLCKQSLAKTSEIFKDIDLNLDEQLNYENNNIEEENIEITRKQNVTAQVDVIAQNINDVDDVQMNIVDQTLLKEFENETIEEPLDSKIDTCGIKSSCNIKSKEIESKKADVTLRESYKDTNDNSYVNFNVNFDPGISEESRFGFKTANNKVIKISEESLVKTKNIFHDIGLDLLNYQESKDNNNMFSNKNCDPSCEKNCTEAVDVNDFQKLVHPSSLYKTDNKSGFHGFRTATNKAITVSEDALLKTRKLFQDFDLAGIGKDDLQEKIEENSNNLVNLCDKKDFQSSSPLQGFKTASNKPLIISKEALIKSTKIFHGIDNSNNITAKDDSCAHSRGIKNVDCLNMTTNNNLVKLNAASSSDDVESGVRKEVKINNCDVVHGFQGFKTASNKKVIVSEESLKKTSKIFQDIDDVSDSKNMLLKSAKYALVNIKNTAKSTHDKESEQNLVTSMPLGYHGFKTASDKEVVITEDALAKTKDMFKNVDFETINTMTNEDVRKTAEEAEKREYVITTFKGFQTASNKNVEVSDEAIANSRKIFDEFHYHPGSKDLPERNNSFVADNKIDDTFEFKTATNKSIKISEDALKKSRRLFSDLENNVNNEIDGLKVHNCLAIDTKNNINIDNIVNTQVLNIFEETLNTEDFHNDNTPKQCKRSGSPILSCPKAKKRKKFEAPYRTSKTIENIQIEKVVNHIKRNSNVKYTFSKDYKKNKLYSLKEIDKIDKSFDSIAIIDPYILNFEFETLLKFEFEGNRNDFTDVRWTTDNIKTCFLESVNEKIIPEGWLDNHLKLILWKLISYEIRLPNAMKGACSVRNVLEQLKYRYDIELYRVKRPILRKLLERDDVSTRTMVLAVVEVYVDGVRMHNVRNPSASVELLVTDGWYCVKATADRLVARLVAEGKIAVGRKIATAGAELVNCEQGVSPWEDTSSVRLKLYGNSTRPARWDARLGAASGPIVSHLSTVEPAGGKVCQTRVYVARVYPPLYVEKLEDGSTITRSERLEHLHQIKHDSERQARLEKLYEEVEKELYDQESLESDVDDVGVKGSGHSGSELHGRIKEFSDSSQLISHLTESQAALVQARSSKRKEAAHERLRTRVHEEVARRRLCVDRSVVPLLKMRAAGPCRHRDGKVCKAMISIWRPSDAVQEVVAEGAWVDVYNVVPTAVRNSEIQISAGRQSVFHRSKCKETDNTTPQIGALRRKCFTTKELNKFPTMQTDFNEIDTVGLVFDTEPSLKDFKTNQHQFQNVYITDVDKKFICINFWGGIKKFGYENIFERGNIVACMNLQKRAGNTRRTIPQYRATELSVFTKTPKLNSVSRIIDEFNKAIFHWDIKKFCEDCVTIKNNYSNIKQTEFSPYRFNTSDHNLTRNKAFIDSPLAIHKDVNINLTGLDFESTFKQTETQELPPTILKRKQIVKEKIAKLKMYGEPPPLSKIHILNKSEHAGSAFKSPLTLATNVSSVKTLESPVSTNSHLKSSPILSLNRTYVVRPVMNPVKLNFSSTSGGDDRIETNPFEEEFDASPPLSLE